MEIPPLSSNIFGMDHFESVFMGLINFSMSLFPLKYVLELYLVIISFDAIILVYFFCYAHMAFLCHFISSVKLKKKPFHFRFLTFLISFPSVPYRVSAKPVLFCATFTLTFISVTLYGVGQKVHSQDIRKKLG